MPKNVQIQIKEPCHQNWADMQAAGEGRYCGSCSKVVVDFSLMSDQEILQHIANASQGVCGRMTGDQLNRNIAVEPEKRKKLWALWHFLVAGLLVSSRVPAQTNAVKAGVHQSVKKLSDKEMEASLEWPNTGVLVQGEMTIREDPRLPKGFWPVVGGKDSLPLPAKRRVPPVCVPVQMKETDPDRVFMGKVAAKLPRPTWRDSLKRSSKSVPKIPMRQNMVVKTYPHPVAAILPQKAQIRDMQMNEPIVATQDRRVDSTSRDSIKYQVLEPVTVTGYGYTRGYILVGAMSSVKSVYITDILKDTVDNLLNSAGIKCNKLSLYPNPAARGSVITLSIQSAPAGRWRLGLFSSAGALLQEKYVEVSGKAQVELWNIPASLPGGVYVVKMDRPETGETYTKKLVVQ